MGRKTIRLSCGSQIQSERVANSAIMLFWLEFMLLPILGTSATLLVIDLFKSLSTQVSRSCLDYSVLLDR